MSTNSERISRAITANEAYLAGENEYQLSPDAHAQRILAMLNLSPGLWHEGVQARKQVGLEPLDVLELAFVGKLRERLIQSRVELTEQLELNRLQAAKEYKKKRGQSF